MIVKRKVNVELQTYNAWIHRAIIDPQEVAAPLGITFHNPNKGRRYTKHELTITSGGFSGNANPLQLTGEGLL